MAIPGFIPNSQEWAQQQTAQCSFSDLRNFSPAIDFLVAHASNPRGSTGKVLGNSKAERKRGYRFVENKNIKAKDIDEGSVNSLRVTILSITKNKLPHFRWFLSE